MNELLSAGLMFSAFSFAAAVALLMIENVTARGSRLVEAGGPYIVHGAAASITWLLIPDGWYVLPPFAVALAAALMSSPVLGRFTVPGRLVLLTNALLMLWGLPWAIWFVATIPVSIPTRVLMSAGFLLITLAVPSGLVTTLEQWEVLCRRKWRRPRAAYPSRTTDRYPKVSLHVPVHSEPPEIVIATLDSLARLDYPNFEVLVIDNNTQDPALWRPVEAHCERLGERFRFFRLEHWPGAKAGALNFALPQSAPDAEIVGVVDSDYQADRDFLRALVGYFDDSKMGFVQTPHDYREWEDSLFLRMCYWEYKYFFHTMLVSRNERDAALTVGTMCLIRRKALEEAGGWAEWCVTEDSELAIRIHALGYSSVYLNETFGRGLIPDTFHGYKRQRFRWTYGPVQELKRHFRLCLPWPLRRRSDLSTFQKIHHLNHGLDRLNVGLGFMLLPVGLAVITSMVAHREVVPVPLVLWLTATVLLITGFAIRWLVYRVVIGCSLFDMFCALIASKSLTHTVTMASIWGAITRSIPWQRTNKFKALPLGLGAIGHAQAELVAGILALLLAGGLFAYMPQQGLLLMFLIGAVYQALDYLAAPAMALIASRDIQSNQLPVASNLARASQTGFEGDVA